MGSSAGKGATSQCAPTRSMQPALAWLDEGRGSSRNQSDPKNKNDPWAANNLSHVQHCEQRQAMQHKGDWQPSAIPSYPQERQLDTQERQLDTQEPSVCDEWLGGQKVPARN